LADAKKRLRKLSTSKVTDGMVVNRSGGGILHLLMSKSGMNGKGGGRNRGGQKRKMGYK